MFFRTTVSCWQQIPMFVSGNSQGPIFPDEPGTRQASSQVRGALVGTRQCLGRHETWATSVLWCQLWVVYGYMVTYIYVNVYISKWLYDVVYIYTYYIMYIYTYVCIVYIWFLYIYMLYCQPNISEGNDIKQY